MPKSRACRELKVGQIRTQNVASLKEACESVLRQMVSVRKQVSLEVDQGNLQGDIRTSTEGEPIGKEEQKQLCLGRETFSKQRWRTTCSKKPQTYGKIFREH